MPPQKKPFPGARFLLSATVIAATVAYALWQNFGQTTPLKSTAQVPAPATTAPQPNSAPNAAGTYADGSYTGTATDAYYGTVQVKAIISGGKIADVQFLQYPSDRSTSVRVNTQAMPLLTQEAIAAQNANVDIVSGATATSQAFQISLASALTQAKS